MPEFGIKDAIDILIVAVLLYYIFRQMKESGTINIFYGVMAFIAVWAVAGEVFELRLTGPVGVGHNIPRPDKTFSYRIGQSSTLAFFAQAFQSPR